MAVILNSAFYAMNVDRAERGRETFVAQQTAKYDQIIVSPSFTHYLIPCLFMLGFIFVMYELFAFVICKFLNKMFYEKNNT